jgi:hypothetical protein
MSYSGLPPIQITLEQPSSGRTGPLLLVWLVLVAALVAASFFGVNWFAKLPPPRNVGTPASDFQAYAKTVWPKGTPTVYKSGAIADYAITFLWDTADAATLEAVPVAPNLQLSWPPPQGSRFRLAAYPFGSKPSGIFLWDVAKRIFETLNSYRDVATFPGWFVSVYDKDYWPRKCPYYASKPTSATQRCSATFGMFQWIEVLRACYLLPGLDYPACDDGGHWFYHSPGSGIWYNLGTTLVRFNKIDALLFLMAQMAIKAGVANISPLTDMSPSIEASTDTAKTAVLKGVYAACLEGLDLKDLKGSTWPDLWTKAKSQLATYMDARRGDADIFAAIRALIAQGVRDKSQVPFIFYREQVDEGRAEQSYYVLTALLAGVVASVLAVVLSLLTVFSGFPLVPLLVFLGAAAGAAAYVWYVQLGRLLADMGFVTLQGGLVKRKATIDDVLTYLTEPPENPEDAERIKIQAFSGLPQTQVFDKAIEAFASQLGYDSVVFFAQANKSGTYTVEIVDVTRVAIPTVKGDFWKGGLCGSTPPPENVRCDGVSDLKFYRGGLCWDKGAGKKIPNPSVYQFMNSKAATTTTTPPSSENLVQYTNETKTLFALNDRQPCACQDLTASSQPQHCLNCKVVSTPTASASLCLQ